MAELIREKLTLPNAGKNSYFTLVARLALVK